MISPVLRSLFEVDLQFHLADGTPLDGSVWIGETEFSPLAVLNQDPVAYTEEFNRWFRMVWLPEMKDVREGAFQSRADSQRFEEVRAAVGRTTVVPFVGSGMSVPCGLPTWSQLLRKVRERTNVSAGKLARLIGAGQFEEAADLLAADHKKRLFDECIERELRFSDGTELTGPVRLVPLLFPRLVITTNLDEILELSFKLDENPPLIVLAGTEVARYREVKSEGQRILLKLHGDRKRADTRVLLKSEYEATYGPGGVAREELELLARNNHLLFLGCSLGPDRIVRLLEEVAGRDRHMPRHFAILKTPVDSRQRIQREEFLTRRGVFPIWYRGDYVQSITAMLAGLLCDHDNKTREVPS